MDNMKDWARSKTTSDMSWESGSEALLTEIKGVLSALFEGSPFYAERNTTPNEKSVDIFFNGEKKRAASVWPKAKSRCADLLLNKEYVDKLRLRIELPDDIDLKPGMVNPRKFKAISIEKVIEIFDCLSQL